MKKIILSLLSSCLTLHAVAPTANNELIIPLSVDATTEGKKPLKPVYLAMLRPCENAYERALNELLIQDFNLNGAASLLEIEEMKQYYAHHPKQDEAFQAKRWRDWKARFVIVPTVTKNELQIKIFDVATATLKMMNPIPLSGTLSHDSRLLHKAVDALHKLLFNVEGIASKRILFAFQPRIEQESTGRWHSEIWEMDIQGKNLKQITYENHYSISPVFIPNSSSSDHYSFLYVTYKQGQPRVYIAAREDRRGRPLIPLRGNQLLPAISRQSDKIAFISDAGGRTDLFLQPFSLDRGMQGKPIQISSATDTVHASPSFSPDGKKIAFISDKAGTPRVYIIDVKESGEKATISNARVISKTQRDNGAPSWSPDGKKIVYSASVGGVRQLWLYDVEKQEERQLTKSLGNKENPSWASNSQHLIYNSTSPTFDIFLLNIADNEPVKLTEGAGIKHFPAFEP